MAGNLQSGVDWTAGWSGSVKELRWRRESSVKCIRPAKPSTSLFGLQLIAVYR